MTVNSRFGPSLSDIKINYFLCCKDNLSILFTKVTEKNRLTC